MILTLPLITLKYDALTIRYKKTAFNSVREKMEKHVHEREAFEKSGYAFNSS